jgi:hypothetical protein
MTDGVFEEVFLSESDPCEGYRTVIRILAEEKAELDSRLDRVRDLIDEALSKKLLGSFVNYGEMLEAKNLLALASRISHRMDEEAVDA